MSGELLFQNVDALLKADIFIVVADFSLCARRVDRLRQFVALRKAFRQPDSADGSVLLIACPAAARDVAAHDAFDRKHGELFYEHAVPAVIFSAEELRHILRIDADHVVRKDVLRVIEPEF